MKSLFWKTAVSRSGMVQDLVPAFAVSKAMAQPRRAKERNLVCPSTTEHKELIAKTYFRTWSAILGV